MRGLRKLYISDLTRARKSPRRESKGCPPLSLVVTIRSLSCILARTVFVMSPNDRKWRHPGGKLRELGADKLSETELLAVLISSGTKGRSAESIARDFMDRHGSLAGLANQPLETLLNIKGLGDVKILRIAAALELARRTANEIIHERERQTK